MVESGSDGEMSSKAPVCVPNQQTCIKCTVLDKQCRRLIKFSTFNSSFFFSVQAGVLLQAVIHCLKTI